MVVMIEPAEKGLALAIHSLASPVLIPTIKQVVQLPSTQVSDVDTH